MLKHPLLFLLKNSHMLLIICFSAIKYGNSFCQNTYPVLCGNSACLYEVLFVKTKSACPKCENNQPKKIKIKKSVIIYLFFLLRSREMHKHFHTTLLAAMTQQNNQQFRFWGRVHDLDRRQSPFKKREIWNQKGIFIAKEIQGTFAVGWDKDLSLIGVR